MSGDYIFYNMPSIMRFRSGLSRTWKFGTVALVASSGGFALPAMAREPGQGALYNAGVSIGIPTGVNPPRGFLITNSINFYDATTSPTTLNGVPPSTIHVFSEAPRFFWTTPWRILGATEMMWVAQPYVRLKVKTAGGTFTGSGFGNTLIEPINLSWKLGGGFHASVSAGAYIPIGSYSKSAKVHIGNDFWTIQPEASLSYMSKDYKFTLHAVYNTNTTSTRSGYRSGDQFFLEAYGTKSFGRLSIGPVAYFGKQVTADNPGKITTAISTRPEQVAVGGIASYNFGNFTFQTYVTRDVEARYGGTEGTRIWTRISVPLTSHKSGL